MKIRTGFVTNSSSTSYTVIKITISEYEEFDEDWLVDKITELLEKENIDGDVSIEYKEVERN